jgi:CRISPR system Cascade subunit CasC
MKTVIDIHVIQTVPPSCINRDDTGSPKTAIYGGVTRARVSSQAWKKAVRDEFRKRLDPDKIGSRTMFYADIVKAKLINAEYDEEEAARRADAAFRATGVKNIGKALFFISRPQLNRVADYAKELSDDDLLLLEKPDKQLSKDEKKYLSDLKKQKRELIIQDNTFDIALFGRMVADNPMLNCDAACQVAHAISVNEIENEFDFFTALDDIKNEDSDAEDAGAGHLGVVEYNSSTLYRYATIYVNELKRNLSDNTDLTLDAVTEFIKAFVKSMPTGKSNTFANNTLPSFVLVTIRNDQPVNLVTAFEDPADARRNKSVSKVAITKLADEQERLYANIIGRPAAAFVVSLDDAVQVYDGEKSKTVQDAFDAKKVSLDELVTDVASYVSKSLEKTCEK